MWIDHETAEDLVNFAGIATTITDIIMTPGLTPLTIGVHGDWGYGKSSVLRMVESSLKERSGVLTLYFNGWAFEGFEDAKIALMDSIISELARKRSIYTKATAELGKLAKRIRWFKVARKLFSTAFAMTTGTPDVSTFVESVKLGDGGKGDDEWLKEAEEESAYRHIHEFREEFAKYLKKAQIERLVIFVDDLDRCLPEDTIATLEAVRLFLSVEGSTFVIGADEGMIEYAVRRHFPDLTKATNGVVSTRATEFTKNYLEKLIQLPFRLPQLTVFETRRYITLLLVEEALRGVSGAFAAVLQNVRKKDAEPWVEPDLDALIDEGMMGIEIATTTRELVKERMRLAAQIARPLADRYVGNPRQVKRFLNTLTLRLAVARAYGVADKVGMAELAKLMVLERRNSDAYRTISAEVAASRGGVVGEIQELEKLAKAKDEAIRDRIENLFGKADVEQIEEWLRTDPEIGGLDLRPYLFVSREKLVNFVGGDSLPIELNELATLLSGDSTIAVKSAAARLKTLTREQALMIANILFDRVRESSDLKQQPNELKHFAELSNERPELQAQFVRFLESLPVSDLGLWASTRLTAVVRDSQLKSAKDALMQRWIASDNLQLAAAAKAAAEL